MALIKAENLKKIYKSGVVETTVINDLSLEINEGEFTVITGPSGSGKSTLLYLLSGMEPLSGGKVFIDGDELSSMSDEKISMLRRNKVAFIYQFYNLLEEMNVEDNIFLPHLIGNEKIDIGRLNETLKMVNLEKYSKSYPYELSGGQQQRVAIARALYSNPKVIFADEPTGNLDSANGENVMSILREINNEYKTTIIMVTHSDKFSDYGTRKIYIKDGDICEQQICNKNI